MRLIISFNVIIILIKYTIIKNRNEIIIYEIILFFVYNNCFNKQKSFFIKIQIRLYINTNNTSLLIIKYKKKQKINFVFIKVIIETTELLIHANNLSYYQNARKYYNKHFYI